MRPKVRGLLGPLRDYLSRGTTWSGIIVGEIGVMAVGRLSAIFLIQPVGTIMEVGVRMASVHALSLILLYHILFPVICGIISRRQ